MQGLFARVGSGDPVRVLRLFHNNYTGYCCIHLLCITTYNLSLPRLSANYYGLPTTVQLRAAHKNRCSRVGVSRSTASGTVLYLPRTVSLWDRSLWTLKVIKLDLDTSSPCSRCTPRVIPRVDLSPLTVSLWTVKVIKLDLDTSSPCSRCTPRVVPIVPRVDLSPLTVSLWTLKVIKLDLDTSSPCSRCTPCVVPVIPLCRPRSPGMFPSVTL